MIAYFDTSAFLKLVLEESGSDRARYLWRSCQEAVSSVLLYAESRAGLAMAHRLGRLSEFGRAREAVESLYAATHTVTADDHLIRRAGQLAEHLALRGYDAVHMASAELLRGPDLVFVSADNRQAEAAGVLGLAIASVS
ncbi:MAG: PIN domain-containing protein [Streptosporangiales bacterium]|nr:PIN domain-containing protein [Streptosporangiales bacterium]